MSDEQHEDQIARLEDLCDYYELQWRRASMGAITANKGIRRLQDRVESLKAALDEAREEVLYRGGVVSRLMNQNEELQKKVQRLSLKILDLWSRE